MGLAYSLNTTSNYLMEKTVPIAEAIPKEHFFISKALDDFFRSIYDIYKFIISYFKEVFSPPFELKEIINQCYQVGVRSLALVSVTGFVVGIVFTKQSRPSLATFGASSWLPSLMSVAIIRALGPLVTALIASGKVGSNMGAELGSMKVTEQIDAMEVSGTNPFKYLVASRITAVMLMLPVLVLYTGFIGMLGSYLNVHANELTSFTSFFRQALSKISFLDIISSLIKSLFFGFTIGVAGCYQGYHAENGTRGVGMAANKAVVISMFLIFMEEMLIVQVVNAIR
ncbi:MlaE family ABC transporter permease [Parasediminibacterium sp. JCM 36343]|uniref:MlaE family ABC transporter permease n=1 Tax=Parasediminibacterium sp. JCM 36343 TaxID=3374279 RepID=UPI00397D9692